MVATLVRVCDARVRSHLGAQILDPEGPWSPAHGQLLFFSHNDLPMHSTRPRWVCIAFDAHFVRDENGNREKSVLPFAPMRFHRPSLARAFE